MKIACIIPSRYSSSRFVGKPLADIFGKPMIQCVYERACQSKLVDSVIVSTDDERIYAAVKAFNGNAIISSKENRTGTDRIAESSAKAGFDADDIIVNIQGDQPLFESAQIDEVVQPLLEDKGLPMASLVYKITEDAEITNPHAVKTVISADGFALYFSRATIPFVRDAGLKADYYKHHGIYAYRKWFLDIFSKLPTGKLEQLESLEQLRVLEYGYPIKVVISKYDSLEVDTPEELGKVKQFILQTQK